MLFDLLDIVCDDIEREELLVPHQGRFHFFNVNKGSLDVVVDPLGRSLRLGASFHHL